MGIPAWIQPLHLRCSWHAILYHAISMCAIDGGLFDSACLFKLIFHGMHACILHLFVSLWISILARMLCVDVTSYHYHLSYYRLNDMRFRYTIKLSTGSRSLSPYLTFSPTYRPTLPTSIHPFVPPSFKLALFYLSSIHTYIHTYLLISPVIYVLEPRRKKKNRIMNHLEKTNFLPLRHVMSCHVMSVLRNIPEKMAPIPRDTILVNTISTTLFNLLSWLIS